MISKGSKHLQAIKSVGPTALLDIFQYFKSVQLLPIENAHQKVTWAPKHHLTCPSNMSLCSPARSCSELLVLRMERLWDLRFCFAWRADAQLPLSIGITSKKQLHRGSYDKLRTSITHYKLLHQTNHNLNIFVKMEIFSSTKLWSCLVCH